MPRLSKLIEKLEDRLEPIIGPWYERHKKRLPLYAALVLAGWYRQDVEAPAVPGGLAAGEPFVTRPGEQAHQQSNHRRSPQAERGKQHKPVGVFVLTAEAISAVTGRKPVPYVPPRTQFTTSKGDVADAPLIQAHRKTGRSS